MTLLAYSDDEVRIRSPGRKRMAVKALIQARVALSASATSSGPAPMSAATEARTATVRARRRVGRLVPAELDLEVEVAAHDIDDGRRQQRRAGVVEVGVAGAGRRVVPGPLEIEGHAASSAREPHRHAGPWRAASSRLTRADRSTDTVQVHDRRQHHGRPDGPRPRPPRAADRPGALIALPERGVGVRVFVAGAGHDVVAMTRTPASSTSCAAWGPRPGCATSSTPTRSTAVVVAASPEVVVHQLTDLPDDPAQLAAGRGANARIREDGTDHVLAAAAAAGAARVVVQSIAWLIDGERPPSVVHLERASRAAGGVVLRYGQWYGPGTYHPHRPPPPPRVHVDAAARATLDALGLEPGTYAVTDDGIAAADDA